MKVVINKWLRLLRVKHYIKNYLVFVPMIFGGVLLDPPRLRKAMLGFLAFCALSSAIYVINDSRDIEKDRLHPTKRFRPLAEGSISRKAAFAAVVLLLTATALLSAAIGSLAGWFCLGIYFLLNLLYSFGMKNLPVADIFLLASGYVLRVFYGGFITDVDVSAWLYLVIITGSLYMGLGKRRNELLQQNGTRPVLSRYNVDFLDKNMYVCVALADVFYALWAVNHEDARMAVTVPLFLAVMMYYSLIVSSSSSDGDPVEVFFSYPLLILLSAVYVGIVVIILYFG